MFARDVVTPNCLMFSLCCPEKLSLVVRACNKTGYLPPVQCWSCSLTCMCVYLSFSLGQKSFWSGSIPCQGCLHSIRFVSLFWMGSRKDLPEGRDLHMCGMQCRKVFLLVLCEKTVAKACQVGGGRSTCTGAEYAVLARLPGPLGERADSVMTNAGLAGGGRSAEVWET